MRSLYRLHGRLVDRMLAGPSWHWYHCAALAAVRLTLVAGERAIVWWEMAQ